MRLTLATIAVAAQVVIGLSLAQTGIGASSRAAGFPPPQLVARLAAEDIIVTRPLPNDHPRTTLKQAIAAVAREGGRRLKKPYLVYALRFTLTSHAVTGIPVWKDRLAWFFVVPHVRFPILGRCTVRCFYYSDMVTVVDATSGRWLFASSLRL